MRSGNLVLLGLASFALQGCWFIFIPGSVISAASDAVTGSEGKHCVGERAKVGDTIRLGDGQPMTVKSVSGTSSRCTNPQHPIRALLVPYDPQIAAKSREVEVKQATPKPAVVKADDKQGNPWIPAGVQSCTDALSSVALREMCAHEDTCQGQTMGIVKYCRNAYADSCVSARTQLATFCGRRSDAERCEATINSVRSHCQ
jgi:hypothetical protein